MATSGKKYTEARSKINREKRYDMEEALNKAQAREDVVDVRGGVTAALARCRPATCRPDGTGQRCASQWAG